MKRLADVPPDERGVPWLRWLMWEITRQCDEYLKTAPKPKQTLNDQREWTPRDDYGWRSAR